MTLGHANLGVTSIYLQGIDSSEVIEAVHGRRAPVVSATSWIADGGPATPAAMHEALQGELARRTGDVEAPR